MNNAPWQMALYFHVHQTCFSAPGLCPHRFLISDKELGLRDIWWNCYLYESITCKVNTCNLKNLKGNLKPNGFSETLQVENMCSGLADTFFICKATFSLSIPGA